MTRAREPGGQLGYAAAIGSAARRCVEDVVVHGAAGTFDGGPLAGKTALPSGQRVRTNAVGGYPLGFEVGNLETITDGQQVVFIRHRQDPARQRARTGQESRSATHRAAPSVIVMSSRKPGAFSRWMQQKMNDRMARKVRRGRGTVMGMDVLILNTVGRRSGEPRYTPVAWFADGEDARLVVASGGGSRHPDWHANLMAHPDRASVELPGGDAVPVTPHELDGADRERAWQRIAAAQPRIAKYQSKSDRTYPVIRLTPR